MILIEFFEGWLIRYGVNERFSTELSAVIAMMAILLLCLIVDFMTKKVVLNIQMSKKYIQVR